MKQCSTKKLMVFCLSILALGTLALPALAQNIGTGYVESLGLQTTDQDPRIFAVEVVRYLMTFLGIISVVIILLGGFRWMTAAGNEDKVAEAKKILAAGVVGLIIILSAFAIVTFVIDITGNALNGGI